MSRLSKFNKGDKVKSVVNPHETYEVLEVLRNELRVKALSKGFQDLEFTCKKSLFEIISNN